MQDLNEVEILQVALAHEERARAFYERMSARHGDSTAGTCSPGSPGRRSPTSGS